MTNQGSDERVPTPVIMERYDLTRDQIKRWQQQGLLKVKGQDAQRRNLYLESEVQAAMRQKNVRVPPQSGQEHSQERLPDGRSAEATCGKCVQSSAALAAARQQIAKLEKDYAKLRDLYRETVAKLA